MTKTGLRPLSLIYFSAEKNTYRGSVCPRANRETEKRGDLPPPGIFFRPSPLFSPQIASQALHSGKQSDTQVPENECSCAFRQNRPPSSYFVLTLKLGYYILCLDVVTQPWVAQFSGRGFPMGLPKLQYASLGNKEGFDRLYFGPRVCRIALLFVCAIWMETRFSFSPRVCGGVRRRFSPGSV